MITTSRILAKIEGELGYVEMGNKTIGERVSAILAEIGEIKKSQTVETKSDGLRGVINPAQGN